MSFSLGEMGIDGDTAVALIQKQVCADYRVESCVPFFARHKGDDGTLVAFRVRIASSGTQKETFVSVRAGSQWRLRSESERLREANPSLSYPLAPTALGENHALLSIAFPFDRRLSGVASILDITKVRRMLSQHGIGCSADGWRVSRRKSTLHIESFRPERRVVVRWRLVLKHDDTGRRRTRSIYLRKYAGGECASDGSVHQWVRALDFPCPWILAQPEPGLTVESALTGARCDQHGGAWLNRLEAIGALLAQLHFLPVPSDRPGLSHAELVKRARVCARDLATLNSGLGLEALAYAGRLSSWAPDQGERVPLHGDCHLAQVVWGVGGPGLVDWDRATLGNGAHDLGTFLAHVALEHPGHVEAAKHHLLAGYASIRSVPKPAVLRWHTCVALLRLINMPLRRFYLDWIERTTSVLADVERLSSSRPS